MLILLLALTFTLEVLLYIPLIWRARILVVGILTGAVPGIASLLVVTQPSVLSVLVAVISLARVFNYLRIAKSRMHEKYLYHMTRRTSLWLVLVQAVLLTLFALHPHLLDPNNGLFLACLGLLQLGAAVVLLSSTTRNLVKSQFSRDMTYLSDKELPTVTVAIPARNETVDLEACLRTVLANDYPKLEILVLDDCSQLQTAEVIKSFAHDGVRFIKGAEPDENWLAKNQAYDRLTEEASGELILFCGVDVRLGNNAIRALVTALSVRKKRMISVMPRRLDGSLSAAFIQPMRYWWEVALPRRTFNRPPVLSTVWLIQRKALQQLGGLAAVSRQIIPEAFFARELVKQDDSYSFMRASNDLDIQTAKTVDEQWATAVRVRYPQIHRKPELALLLAAFDTVVFLGALPVALWATLVGQPVAAVAAIIAAILLTATHVSIVQVTNPANTWIALFNFPVAVVIEMIVGTLSMLKYELGTVAWKDRNICMPVMHANPRPKRHAHDH